MINIAFATDSNYIFQTLVAMESVMRSASYDRDYRFILLLSSDISPEDLKLFDIFADEYSGCVIEKHIIKKEFKEANLSIEHITTPTYYRLLLPDLISDERCLYLDSDLIVRHDLAELYWTDFEDKWIAGVKAPTYCTKKGEAKSTYEKKTGINNLNGYINAGVLLLNLVDLRNNSISSMAMDLSKEDFPTNDQDIINRLCEGRIKHLPYQYNVSEYVIEYPAGVEMLMEAFGSEEVEKGINDPTIVHYASGKKPWEFPDSRYAHYWWEICEKTIWYKSFENICGTYKRINKSLQLELYSSDWFEKIKEYDSVYVYGAGKIARRAIMMLKAQGVKIAGILVSNKEAGQDELLSFPIIQYTKQIENCCVLIATNEKNMVPIRRKLVSDGYLDIAHIPISESELLNMGIVE